jgi:hypothetical protein
MPASWGTDMATQRNAVDVFEEAQKQIRDQLDTLPFLSTTLLGGAPRDIADIAKVELSSVDFPKTRSGLYDHQVRRRKFLLGNNLLEAFGKCWIRHQLDDRMQVMMAQLFLLHEYHHIVQKVSSDRYYISGASSYNKYATLDYRADALSIKARYLFEQKTNPINLSLLTDILAAQVYAGEAFGSIEDAGGGPTPRSIAGGRLRRQLIWHFQHARAMAFLPEATFDEFNIEREVNFQLFKHLRSGRMADLCSKRAALVPADFGPPLECHITTGAVTQQYAISTPEQSDALKRVIFDVSLEDTYQLFRAFFENERAWIDGYGAEEGAPKIPRAVTISRESAKIDATELQELLRRKEGLTLEFKLKYDLSGPDKERRRDELAKDIIALINSAGRNEDDYAFLIIGAGDELLPDGTRRHERVQSGQYLQRTFIDLVNARCTPSVLEIHYQEVEVAGRGYGVIILPPSPHVHALSRDIQTPGGIWRKHSVLIRSGDGTALASEEQVRAIRAQKSAWANPIKQEASQPGSSSRRPVANRYFIYALYSHRIIERAHNGVCPAGMVGFFSVAHGANGKQAISDGKVFYYFGTKDAETNFEYRGPWKSEICMVAEPSDPSVIKWLQFNEEKGAPDQPTIYQGWFNFELNDKKGVLGKRSSSDASFSDVNRDRSGRAYFEEMSADDFEVFVERLINSDISLSSSVEALIKQARLI